MPAGKNFWYFFWFAVESTIHNPAVEKTRDTFFKAGFPTLDHYVFRGREDGGGIRACLPYEKIDDLKGAAVVKA